MFAPGASYQQGSQEGQVHGKGGAQYHGQNQYNPESVIANGTPSIYQLKTMCLAKKTVQMPTKEEHGFLLFCGLGARKWSVAMDCNSLTFKQAILNIYPRLRSVIGYNLWTLTKDKKFERIPEKVNTPARIRTFLGTQFTGCLIIVPVSDIVLMEEKREHLRQKDISDDNKSPGHVQPEPTKVIHERQDAQGSQTHRSLCLICGKIEKTAGTGTFHRIHEEKVQVGQEKQIISKRLTDILGFNFEQSKKKFIASTEICKKCLRTVTDVGKLEEQLKMTKEDLVSSFFNTTSKFNKNHREVEDLKGSPPTTQNSSLPTTSHSSNGYSHPFIQRPLPLQMAIFNQQQANMEAPLPAATPYGPGLIQFYSRPTYNPTQYSDREPEYERRNGLTVMAKDNRNGSDYGGSEVGSSSFLSASPTPRPDYGDSESVSGPVSPQPFDTRSYASTFSFRSTTSSIRSKGEIKAYDADLHGNLDHRSDPEQKEPEDCTLPKGDSRDQQNSPGSQGETSPRQMDSPSSMDSSVNGTTPPPGDQNLDSKEAEDQEDMRKPWKKRKRLQAESDPENFSDSKKAKEDGHDSPESSETQEPVNCDEP